MSTPSVSNIDIYLTGKTQRVDFVYSNFSGSINDFNRVCYDLIIPNFIRSHDGQLHPIYRDEEGNQTVDTQVYLCDKVGNPLFFQLQLRRKHA